MNARGILRASVVPVGTLKGTIAKPSDMSAVVYDGPYVCTPDVSECLLETKHRFMTDNVIVQKIPYFEVTNNAGGTTATICNLEV